MSTRIVITPTTQAMDNFATLTFTTLAAAKDGWYLNDSNFSDMLIIGQSTHTSAVEIKMKSAGTSTSATDWILKEMSDLTTSIGTSGVGVWKITPDRFKSTDGLVITSTITGSTAIGWAAIYR
jgi:hypothetical protein